MIIIYLLLGLLAAAGVLLSVASRCQDPLLHIPGPRIARYTRFWRMFDVWRSHCDLTELDLHREFGHFVRLGPSLVSISDPAYIKLIYAYRPVFIKSPFYGAGDATTNGQRNETNFSARDEINHAAHLRPVVGQYSIANLMKFEPRIDSAINLLIYKLKQGISTTSAYPIGTALKYFAWDVSGELNFSKRFGAMDEDPRALDLIDQVSRGMDYLAVIGQVPWLNDFCKSKWYPFTIPGFGYAISLAVSTLTDRLASRDYTDQRDFVDLFIDAEKNKAIGGIGAAQLTLRQISWLASNVLAGADSTAAAIQSAVYYVSRSSAIQKRLAAELQTNLTADEITYKKAAALPYLDAVIKETFRLEPGVGMLLERVVPSSGLELPDGSILPPGTVVGMNARVLNHDTNVYGPDAGEFNPDRWLQAQDESTEDFIDRLACMNRTDFTFGRGPRACFGKPIALLELYKCLARLFIEFEMTLEHPSDKLHVTNRWFMVVHGLHCFLSERGNSLEEEKDFLA